MESLLSTKVLTFLQGDILYFGFNPYLDIGQIHWCLESYDGFLVIRDSWIGILSTHFSFACCRFAFQIDFHIFQKCDAGFSSIYFQSWPDEDGSFLAHQHLLTVHMELCVEFVILAFLLEFGELGKTIVDHDNFARSLILSIRDQNRPILFWVAWIKLIVQPESCLFSFANVSGVVDDESHMTCWCGTMN